MGQGSLSCISERDLSDSEDCCDFSFSFFFFILKGSELVRFFAIRFELFGTHRVQTDFGVLV